MDYIKGNENSVIKLLLLFTQSCMLLLLFFVFNGIQRISEVFFHTKTKTWSQQHAYSQSNEEKQYFLIELFIQNVKHLILFSEQIKKNTYTHIYICVCVLIMQTFQQLSLASS